MKQFHVVSRITNSLGDRLYLNGWSADRQPICSMALHLAIRFPSEDEARSAIRIAFAACDAQWTIDLVTVYPRYVTRTCLTTGRTLYILEPQSGWVRDSVEPEEPTG